MKGEKNNVTLLCTLNVSNDNVQNFHLFRSLGRTGNYKFGPGSKWLAKAKRLESILDLRDASVAIDASSKGATSHTATQPSKSKRRNSLPTSREL